MKRKAKKNTIPSRARKKQKESHFWLWMGAAIVCMVVVAAGAYFASASLFDKPRAERRRLFDTLSESRPSEPMLVAHDKATVMIMGVDERDDDVGRSDTLMLAFIDPQKKQASLLSIPRDTRVRYRSGSYEKINSAYSIGGWKLTRDIVEELLDTPVDHYVLINTRSFPRIIDAIGGVDLDVEKRMEYVDEWDDSLPGGLVIDLYPGMQHLDGVTAMSYVRYRDEDGDIGRIARQQKFMKAVAEKVTSPAIIPQLPRVLNECRNAVETDLSLRQLLELAGSLKEAQANGLQSDMLVGRPLYIDGISYWIPDLTETRTRLASVLGISLSSEAISEMRRDALEYENSIPDDATDVPEDDTSVGRSSDKIESGRVRPSTYPGYLPPSPSRPGSLEREDSGRTGRVSPRVPPLDGDGRRTTEEDDEREERSGVVTPRGETEPGGEVPERNDRPLLPHDTVGTSPSQRVPVPSDLGGDSGIARPTRPSAPTPPTPPSVNSPTGGKGQ